MPIDLFRQRQIECHQHRRPDDRVEPHDLLADKVHIGGPVLLKIVVLLIAIAERSDIVGECVHPDIDNMLRIKSDRNPPFKRGDRKSVV